ncbi:5-methyltetrahydropteroyltriglutamate--homocysteine S-methyltransferase [Saccharibacillus sp. CPCC 101409]|uniref:5-methyltetrahydropteroyltriglutamate-- homocysteine S-methyltransferase n=1 Tax=Saccharibacillus sp. CPCC 101409 TaxID=3058041 RepID=UPI002673E4B4|nr:5-methyltetrahydropteroyltriglutamate--homocysteine S-methyltransferase [Saccharibacillus sp. CPCC 101409]MDO3412533.1 5-methyltetrahydropteroyltriglutamate--homocysteine S-methyltransferase [Saccharibacillus sp. CPCC 101409]
MQSPVTGTNRDAPPFRCDIVGSFLRPPELIEARRLHRARQLTDGGLYEIETAEIAGLVEKQKQAGLRVVTDGEFRRSWWHLDFFLGVEGTEKIDLNALAGRADAKQRAETFRIADRIVFGDHPMLEHFRSLKRLAAESAPEAVPKMTIPSPSLFHFVQRYNGGGVYADEEELYADIIAVYRDAIQAFYDAGCRYLQLDDTSWGTLCSLLHRTQMRSQGTDPDKLAADYVRLINESIEGRPGDMTIALHVCRGNFHSTWFASGGYEPVAEALFGGCRVDAFFLEYDNERAGGFEPLRFVQDQFVVLGLVTTKHGGLESKDVLKARIAEAAAFVPLDRLCLSTQCGFASSEEGNLLTEEEQWDKIRLVAETAAEVWPRRK